MSANSTSRANRSSKEKSSKTQPQQTQNAKDGTAKGKAIAEQIQTVDDPDLQQKVLQLIDLTQKSNDEVVIALHDCDNDVTRAINMLLEGDNDQGEWQETGKKRKRGAPPVNSPAPEPPNVKPEFTITRQQTDKREKSNDREFKEQSHRSESSSRGRRRDDGPPRFQRGGKSMWRGKENEENERNRTESKGRDNRDRDRDRDNTNRDRDNTNRDRDNRDNRERSFDRGRGRGRGGRGRGRGRGGPMDRGERGERGGAGGTMSMSTGTFNRSPPSQGGFDSGPHIDTWTNDQAVVEQKSGWENMMTEDWNDDAWTGSNPPEQKIHVNTLDTQFNLNETTVFTASTIGSVRKVETPPSEPFGQNGTIGQSNSLGQSGIIGQSNSMGHGSAVGERSPLQTGGAIGQSNSLGQTSAIGQVSMGGTNSLTGSLDLGALLQQKPNTDVVSNMTSSQPTSSQPMTLSQSQFVKQATDALKSIVGIGTSPSSSSHHQMPHSLSSGVTMPGQLPLSSVPITPPPQGHGGMNAQQQRPKPARSKLPPPSKIPASAVEMPGHMSTSLDVQFGFMNDFGTTKTCSESTMSSTFSNSNSVSTTGSAMTNHLPLTSQTPEPSATTVSLMASITPPKTSLSTVEQSTTRTSMYSSSANTTPTKDYTQSNITKPSGISPPEPIPFPSSQADRPKTSPLINSQRPATGSLASTDPVTTYAQSGYSSSYPSSRYQPHKTTPLTTSAYVHGTNSLTSHPSGLQQIPTTVGYQQNPSQYQSQYTASSFQGQTGFSAGPAQGSLYQSTNQQTYGPSSSAYRDSQTGASSYSGQVGGSYPSSQGSGSSYQSSHSQSAGYGTGQSTTYQTTQSSPYAQTQTGPSYQTSQSGSYPSSQSYSNSSQTGSSAYPTNQSNSYQSGSTGASGQSTSSYPTTQASSFPTTQASSYSSSETGSYPSTQSGSRYQSGQSSGQSAGSYQSGSSTGQSGSSYPSVQSSSTLQQTGTTYPSAQSTSSYQTTVTQSSTYSRDSQSALSHQATTNQTYGSHSNYNSTSHQSTLQTSPMSTTKLNESLSKMTVKDTSMDQTQTSYDTATVSSTATLSSTTMTTSSSLAAGSVSVSSSLGLTPMTSAVTSMSASSTKSSTLTNATGTTGKAPPNLPQGVPPALLGPNFIMGQHMPPYFNLTAQQPAAMYCNSYEDLQLLQQQRLPLVSGTKQIQLPTGYYDGTLPFQPPTSLAGGADQRQLGSVPYTGADGKLSRVDAQSPVQGSQTSQQPTQSAHQQAYINPAATLPPGYGYYIAQTGLVPGGFSYTPTMFPQQVPPVTNATHGNTTATTQFQKPAGYAAASHGYGTTGYEDLMQAQDYSKTGYGGVAQVPNKVSVTSGIKVGAVNTSTDLSAAAAYSAKSHAQSFDKQGYHAGTPPPFNMPVAGGTQAGPMGAPAAPYAPYMPILQHQHQPQTQMLHHQLQQQQVPPVTNATHGNTTATTQFQKPAGYAAASHGYGTTGYEDLMQAQDYSKTGYGGVAQVPNKVSVTSGIKVGAVNTSTDLSAAAAYSAKSHAQSFDKQGYHAGTPPPFNMPVAGGTQAGPMGAPAAPYAPYMPILQHQHQPQTQMLHHQLQQDSTGSGRSQQSSNQPKAAGGTKNYSTGYWNA